MFTFTIIEAPTPPHYDLPEGFSPDPGVHHCAAGTECASEPPALLGYYETLNGNGDDTIVFRDAYIVTGFEGEAITLPIPTRPVICEDCAINLNNRDLTLYTDGTFKYVGD